MPQKVPQSAVLSKLSKPIPAFLHSQCLICFHCNKYTEQFMREKKKKKIISVCVGSSVSFSLTISMGAGVKQKVTSNGVRDVICHQVGLICDMALTTLFEKHHHKLFLKHILAIYSVRDKKYCQYSFHFVRGLCTFSKVAPLTFATTDGTSSSLHQ